MRVILIGLILGLLMGGCAEESELERTRRLANDGDASAQYNLGVMYADGEGVPQDDKEAVKWYRMAADQGNATAQNNLALIYARGNGVPQDYREAYAWLSVAKANGQELAEKNLGIIKKKMTKEQIAEAQSLSTEIYNRIEANRKN